ncbi:MAG: flotillin family protein [Clostridia bacterium]|nr:flotillin family protein [Clostridia bacterium]
MKCPADKILAVYSPRSDGSPEPSTIKCYYGKRVLISPFKKHAFLDVSPANVPLELKKAPTLDGYSLNLTGTVTFGISTDPKLMPVAAKELLFLQQDGINRIAKQAINAQAQITASKFTIQEIWCDRNKFFDAMCNNAENALKKFGLKLVNVNISDITDEEGFINAYTREQVRKAIEQAKREIEQEKAAADKTDKAE